MKEMCDEVANGRSGEHCTEQSVGSGVAPPTIKEPAHAMTCAVYEPIAKGGPPSPSNTSLIQPCSDAPSVSKPPSTTANLPQSDESRDGVLWVVYHSASAYKGAVRRGQHLHMFNTDF